MPARIPDYRAQLERDKDIVCAITPEGYASWGWSPPPDMELDWVAERVTALVEQGMPPPAAVCPSPLFGFEVRIEWDLGAHNPRLDVSLDDHSAEWRNGRGKRALDLDGEADWAWVDRRVRRLASERGS